MFRAIQHTLRRVAKVHLDHHGLIGTTDGTDMGKVRGLRSFFGCTSCRLCQDRSDSFLAVATVALAPVFALVIVRWRDQEGVDAFAGKGLLQLIRRLLASRVTIKG